MTDLEPEADLALEMQFQDALDKVKDLYEKLLRRQADSPNGSTHIEDGGRAEAAGTGRLRDLEITVNRLQEENRRLRLQSAVASRKPDVQAADDTLANLYVAGFNLHKALDLEDVLAAVKEILINLVGADSFAIFLLDEAGQGLVQVADENNRHPSSRRVPLNEGIIGVVAKTRIAFFDSDSRVGDFRNPVACVPLHASERLLGVIQIHRLLAQKECLSTQDHKIFNLLAETAGTSLLAAMLRQNYMGHDQDHTSLWRELMLPVVAMSDQDLEQEGEAPAGRRLA